MSTTDDGTRDDVLAVALGEGFSYAKAGELAGISKATVARRMSDVTFRAWVNQLRAERAEEAAAMIDGLALKAAERVGELVDAENELVALKSSLAVLERAEQRRQARAFGDRLARLEELVTEVLDRRLKAAA